MDTILNNLTVLIEILLIPGGLVLLNWLVRSEKGLPPSAGSDAFLFLIGADLSFAIEHEHIAQLMSIAQLKQAPIAVFVGLTVISLGAWLTSVLRVEPSIQSVSHNNVAPVTIATRVSYWWPVVLSVTIFIAVIAMHLAPFVLKGPK